MVFSKLQQTKVQILKVSSLLFKPNLHNFFAVKLRETYQYQKLPTNNYYYLLNVYNAETLLLLKLLIVFNC
jgi:hypothetical protein